jgi:hypothetical protein
MTHSETVGKGCLYLKRMSDINVDLLKRMIKTAFAERNNVRS